MSNTQEIDVIYRKHLIGGPLHGKEYIRDTFTPLCKWYVVIDPFKDQLNERIPTFQHDGEDIVCLAPTLVYNHYPSADYIENRPCGCTVKNKAGWRRGRCPVCDDVVEKREYHVHYFLQEVEIEDNGIRRSIDATTSECYRLDRRSTRRNEGVPEGDRDSEN